MIYTIVYVSCASDAYAPAELDKILEVSRKNNPAKQITGLLLYKAGVFIQVLEGGKDEVKHLFGKISMDERHERVQVVNEGAISARSFPEWAMAHCEIDVLEHEWVNTMLKLAQQPNDYLDHIKSLRKHLS